MIHGRARTLAVVSPSPKILKQMTAFGCALWTLAAGFARGERVDHEKSPPWKHHFRGRSFLHHTAWKNVALTHITQCENYCKLIQNKKIQMAKNVMYKNILFECCTYGKMLYKHISHTLYNFFFWQSSSYNIFSFLLWTFNFRHSWICTIYQLILDCFRHIDVCVLTKRALSIQTYYIVRLIILIW